MKKILLICFIACFAIPMFGQKQTCNCVGVQSVTVSNITNNSATVSWNPSTGQASTCLFVVEVRNLTYATSTSYQVIGTAFNLTGLMSGCTYNVSVSINNVLNCIGPKVYSNNFNTTGSSYCIPTSNNVFNKYFIQNFAFEQTSGINYIYPNPYVGSYYTEGNSYAYQSTETQILKKNTYANNLFSWGIVCNGSNIIPSTTIYLTIWIDYNNNHIFEASEKVNEGYNSFTTGSASCGSVPSNQGYGIASVSPASMPTLVQSFLVPNITANNLRGRCIYSVDQPISGPCMNLSNGQIIDFPVNIIP